ncbi:hypothetical protein M8312_13155 [Sphingomonas sp. KRR8]|uniref:hypothetical protein n=1 Tax=Sphingomonas sp. KRR8 TaxID=2942996 RepID=UPI0020213038|nr:hypothetical protein [Sphingomonas sp. KRR8]URD60707.1 hypothetical protein M8312_13155 [Sphingomonas sp. KRR8]
MPGKRKSSALESASVAALITRPLKAFYHNQPDDPVSTARFYWSKGEGSRESIVPHFEAKCRPGNKGTEEDKAAAVEVLLRGDVPQDYADPLFLAESYMSKLPADENAAFAQITLQFPEATNLHAPWHQARSWMREHFVERVGVPVLAVLHAPFLMGSDNSVHVHGLVLMKRTTCFGWFGVHRDLASDAGLAAAEASWRDWVSK